MKMLISKLPYRMKDRWRRFVDDKEEERNQVCGKTSSSYEKSCIWSTSTAGGEFRRQSSKPARSAGSSFAANFEERSNKASDKHQTSSENTKKLDNDLASKRPCAYCNLQNHSVDCCFKLSDCHISERIKFVKD